MSSYIANSKMSSKRLFFLSIKISINSKYIIFFVCCDKMKWFACVLMGIQPVLFLFVLRQKILRLWQDCNFPTWFLHPYVSILCVLIFLATILIHSNKTYFSLSFVINKPHPTNTFLEWFNLLLYLCLCISCKFKACSM